ncbi:MAG: hypothetical protein ACREGH_02500 [Minisyncoccia bacterium]
MEFCRAVHNRNSTQPSATFDQSSLTTSSANPTITGIASNVSTMVLAIKNQLGVSIANINASVTGGTWAIPIGGLTNGTYSLTLYNIVNGYNLTNAQVLATGTLTVQQ